MHLLPPLKMSHNQIFSWPTYKLTFGTQIILKFTLEVTCYEPDFVPFPRRFRDLNALRLLKNRSDSSSCLDTSASILYVATAWVMLNLKPHDQ